MIKKHIDYIKMILGGIILLQVIITIISRNYIGIVWTKLSIINYILYNLIIIKKKKIENILFLGIILTLSMQVVGVYIIENEVIYLYELSKWSYFKNSLPELVLINLIFEFVLLKNKKNKDFFYREKYLFSNKIEIICYIYILYFFFKVIKMPYFELNIDRFIYRKLFFNKIEYIFWQLYPIVFIILANNFINFKSRVKNILMIGIIFLILFLSGSKFGDFLHLSIFFGWFYIGKRENRKNLKKIVRKIGVILILILTLTYFHKKLLYNYSYGYYLNNYFKQRIAQQGQLWWGTYDKKLLGSLQEFKQEFSKKNEESFEIKKQAGIWKIMLMNAPEDKIKKKFETGSSYTASTQATLNYYLGLGGNIVFFIFVGSGIRKIYLLFFYQVSNNYLEIIRLIAFYKINRIFYAMIGASNFNHLINFNFIIYIIILYFFPRITKNKKKEF